MTGKSFAHPSIFCGLSNVMGDQIRNIAFEYTRKSGYPFASIGPRNIRTSGHKMTGVPKDDLANGIMTGVIARFLH